MEHRVIPKASIPPWLRSDENKAEPRPFVPGDRVKDYAKAKRRRAQEKADRKRGKR